MSEVSNLDLMNVLLEMKQDVGGIKAGLSAHAESFNKHLEEDAKLAESVKQLELTGARAAGKRSAYAFIGGAIGTVLTLAVDYLRK